MYLVTFHSNFDANQFKRKLNNLGEIKLKPVPRELSSSCGTCVSFNPIDSNFDFNEIKNISFEKIFKVEDNKYILLKENE